MRSPKALLAVGVILSLLASAAAAPPPGPVGAPAAAHSANGFVGEVDIVDRRVNVRNLCEDTRASIQAIVCDLRVGAWFSRVAA